MSNVADVIGSNAGSERLRRTSPTRLAQPRLGCRRHHAHRLSQTRRTVPVWPGWVEVSGVVAESVVCTCIRRRSVDRDWSPDVTAAPGVRSPNTATCWPDAGRPSRSRACERGGCCVPEHLRRERDTTQAAASEVRDPGGSGRAEERPIPGLHRPRRRGTRRCAGGGARPGGRPGRRSSGRARWPSAWWSG